MLRVLLFCCLWLIHVNAYALKIAMVLWRGETAAEQGFRDEMKKLGLKPDITVFNANQDRPTLATLLRTELEPDLARYDYVYSFGTTASQMTKQFLKGRKPLIFNVVADPYGAGLLSANKQDNKMLAGVSNMISLPLQIANARKYLPQGSKMLLPVNPREQNTQLIAEQLKPVAAQYNWTLATWRINPDKALIKSELLRLQKDAKDSVVFIPTDSYLISIAPELMQALNEANIETICSVAAFIPYHCSIGTVGDYQIQGKLAAGIIAMHQKGTALQDIPVQYDLSPRLITRDAAAH
ncbi:ABC transporter substrate binding protein [Iodobacter sp. CM08]|uniref:ABC transporter substrate-binding protein n=1 Tax=Iodobacter sp. CM08 TaxID=3085902 RepID=UPI002980B184|nr:ABC transporter substrate binding protein [Iodobacter sp. CM08]MDW5418992.1 ABC transporter substrate binding protein [Iodobacter sp. CM08]